MHIKPESPQAPAPNVGCARAARRAVALLVLVSAFGALPQTARAQWRPPGIAPTQAGLADVLAASARASGSGDPHLAQRRERWTLSTGAQQISVAVAVRDGDYRTSLVLGGLTYMAGRQGGVRWRADGNGITHGIEADLQGDALDRAPQSVFGLDPASCTLAGEARLPAPAWVIRTERDGDKPAYVYIDEGRAIVVRELVRDGKRDIQTDFDDFTPIDGALRARHWRITDGDPADTTDVRVDAIEPGPVDVAEMSFPSRRDFAPATPLATSASLPAHFRNGRITIDAAIGGHREPFLLDTGTTSITIDPALARESGGATLEHAAIPRMTVGPLALDNVSTLVVPLFPGGPRGILGFDFFFGHVVDIDYLHERVRVLSMEDARGVFADPATTTIPIVIDQGLPLARGAIGAASSETFALDTGSPRLYVMSPFMHRYAAEIARDWTPAGLPFLETYLEGGIELQPYRVATFSFADTYARDIIVGGQVPSTRTDDLAIPFEGIIGTDFLRNFDLYFDYDNNRLGIRRR